METIHNQSIIQNVIGFGSVLAIVISWSKDKSISYAIIRGLFGWFYIFYYMLTRTKN